MLNDVGLTFGAANFLNDNGMGSANFAAWAAEPAGRTPDQCIANLRPSFSGTLDQLRASATPAGSSWPSLLQRLSDRQLTALFDVSRIAERRHEVSVLEPASEPPDT